MGGLSKVNHIKYGIGSLIKKMFGNSTKYQTRKSYENYVPESELVIEHPYWEQFKQQVQPLEKMVSAYSLNSHVSFSHDCRSMYVVNPKVASTTMRQALVLHQLSAFQCFTSNPMFGLEDIDARLLWDPETRPYPQLIKLSPFINPLEAIQAKETFKYTIVRHPYNRLCSAYRDFVEKKKPNTQALFALANKEIYTENISFDLFVSLISETSDSKMDIHWRPQTVITLNSFIDYNYVGKLEEFSAAIDVISDATGIKRDFFRANAPHATGSDDREDPLLTKALKERYRVGLKLILKRSAMKFESVRCKISMKHSRPWRPLPVRESFFSLMSFGERTPSGIQ